MRLSLRTLLAFEDNIFDVEQHRRLESLLPTDKDAEATLQRIRSVVRNPNLGVPGLVDRKEELDPNYVAEYLDHQMPSSVQENFESYCLSADKYLAEIASIHHILSNVLGEPARTSRECRLQCYDVLKTNNAMMETKISHLPALETLKHFRPYEASQELVPAKSTALMPFWKRWFPVKPVPQTPAPAEQKPTSSLWTFTVIGLCICALLLFWQQIEKKRIVQQLNEVAETTKEQGTLITEKALALQNPHNSVIPTKTGIQTEDFNTVSLDPRLRGGDEKKDFAALLAEKIDFPVVDVHAEVPGEVPTQWEAADPFASVADSSVADVEQPSVEVADTVQAEPIVEPIDVSIAEAKALSKPKNPEESMIAFQPVTSSAKIPAGVPMRQNPRPALPATVWQSNEEPVQSAPATPNIPFAASVQHPAPVPNPLSRQIAQTSGTAPRGLGRALPTPQPSVIFTAASLRAPWQLLPLPLDLTGDQYLLTAAPFQGTFELAGCFRIEMIGDTKLCVLPLNPEGVPGIFIDYGRIIIRPLQANQSLRIDTEKSRGVVSVPGMESLLFVDTFAEISDPPGSVKPPEEKKKTSPIVGFVPQNEGRMIWRSLDQSQPFVVESQGSLLLQADQYRFGEFRNLPNWLGPMPMSPEDRMLAEACRRYFVDTSGDGEKALTQMVQDESIAVRTLGLRLWGDLGRFDVPLSVMAAKRPEDEPVRRILGRYISEVMRRDAETVQRLADAIEVVKESQ